MGSVLVVRRRVRGLGIPTTEWPLIQPAIDRINAAFAEGQKLAADALASGALTQAGYDALFDESENVAADGTLVTEALWAWPDHFTGAITTRADAARHLRDDAELIADAESAARDVEASLEAFRAQLARGAGAHRNWAVLATIGAGLAGILLVILLAAWMHRRRA